MVEIEPVITNLPPLMGFGLTKYKTTLFPEPSLPEAHTQLDVALMIDGPLQKAKEVNSRAR